MKLKKIDLYTNDYSIINILKKSYKLDKIYTENKLLLKLIKNRSNITLINSKSKILKKIKTNCEFAITYGFGIIFKNFLIKKYKNGIWNIHPGYLPKYRGRHPITAAFLNNDYKIGITIHKINEKIDRGHLLSKSFVKRNYADDENSIKKKILKKILKLLQIAENNLKNKKILVIKKGTYYKPFYDGIKIVNSLKFTATYIFNVAKAQKSYGGFYVNNKKYFDAIHFSKKKINLLTDVIKCKNNKKLLLIKKK